MGEYKDMATLIKKGGNQSENSSSVSSNLGGEEEESDDNSNMAIQKNRDEGDSEEENSENEKSSMSEDDVEEEEGEEDTFHVPIEILTCRADHSYNRKKKGYLSFEKGDLMKVIENVDTNWIKVENSKQEVGLVPLNYVTILKKEHHLLEKQTSDASSKSGKFLWSNLRKAVRQSSKTDILSALGAMPSGFRTSTLQKLLIEDCKYTLECALAPKLSLSNVGFCDLSLKSNDETLVVTTPKVQRTIRLIACRNIPLPGAGVEVLNRHVYICLYDGTKIISNIHRISAKWDSQSPKLWTFTSKNTLSTPCHEDAKVLIRSKHSNVNLGILFEICISLYRASSTEYKEMSCGWVFLKLFDAIGLEINSGTYNLKLNGGDPSEHGIAVDSSIIQSDSINPIKAVVTRLRQPTLIIKVSRPDSNIKNFAIFLRPTFVAAVSLVQLFSIYSQILGETLLKDRLDKQRADPIYSPVLSQFPSIATQCDLMDVMRSAWSEKLKLSKRLDKSKPEYLKRIFISVFMDNIFIYCNIFIPPYFSTDIKDQKVRDEIIKKIQAIIKIKGPSGIFLSPQLSFKPFENSKLCLDILGSHCQHTIDESLRTQNSLK